MADPQLPRLRYLSADRIRGPLPTFDHLQLKNRQDEKLGRLDGIIVDTAAHRMRYFVVEHGFLHRRRFLLPLYPTRVDTEGNVLRMDVDGNDVSRCSTFNPALFPLLE